MLKSVVKEHRSRQPKHYEARRIHEVHMRATEATRMGHMRYNRSFKKRLECDKDGAHEAGSYFKKPLERLSTMLMRNRLYKFELGEIP